MQYPKSEVAGSQGRKISHVQVSHKVVISDVVIVTRRVCNAPANIACRCETGFRLRSLCLLAALLALFLFLQLFIAEGCQPTGSLFDFRARQFRTDLLDKRCHPDGVMRFRRGSRQQRDQRCGKSVELSLGRGFEQGERREVNSLARVFLVLYYHGFGGRSACFRAHAHVGKEILSMLEVGILFRLSQT